MAVDNLISRKKDSYPISDYFESYLRRYGRIVKSSIHYRGSASLRELCSHV